MNLQEFIFGKKGWSKPSSKIPMMVVTSLRSDMVSKGFYCKSFLQDVVIALETLGIKRNAFSLDFCESMLKQATVLNDVSRPSCIVQASLTKNESPLVFVCEHSPIAFITANEAAERITKLHGINQYLLVSIHSAISEVSILVFKDGKVTSFKLNITNKQMKEEPHEYYQLQH